MITDEELLEQLRLALQHLDDPLYLETLSLAGKLSITAQTQGLSRGQELRRALRLAIVALDPAENDAPTQFTTRSYQVLYRFAISRQSMTAIAHHLGISPRQGYRDLHLATQALAHIMRDLLLDTAVPCCSGPETEANPGGRTRRGEEVRRELERLAGMAAQDRVTLGEVIRDVVEKARYLAQRKGIDLLLRQDVAECQIIANKVMLGQALLSLLSHVVAAHEGPQLVVHVRSDGECVLISCAYEHHASPEVPDPQGPYAVAQQLFRTLGISCEITEEGHARRVTVTVPLAQECQILIMDDNPGIIALFTSYLRQLPYRVYGAASAAEALEILNRSHLDVVILDVMMPDRDGWGILEWLRARYGGNGPYIIVCSIINDPQLALALGADAFLRKPVSRGQLLQAIEGASFAAR